MHDVEDVETLERWLRRLLDFAVNDLAQSLVLITGFRGVDSDFWISWTERLAERRQEFHQRCCPCG